MADEKPPALASIATALGATDTDVLVLREAVQGFFMSAGDETPCGCCGKRAPLFAWAHTEREPMRLASLCEPCAIELSGGIRP